MKTKVKNPTEARLEKAKEVFGVDGPELEYEITDTDIVLPGVTATYSKKVKDMKGYEVLKDITIDIEVQDKKFQLKWTGDHGNAWIVQAVINKLITIKRTGKGGLSTEQREKLKEERARYMASKKVK